MAHVFAVSPAEMWPRDWAFQPHELHRVLCILPNQVADTGSAVILVPRPMGLFEAALRVVEQIQRVATMPILLADHVNAPGVTGLMDAHAFDGFLDLSWPPEVARAALDLACRNVQLGRSIVELQRVVLEQARHGAAAEQSQHDELIRLSNHRHFASLIDREHERCMATKRPYALVFVDLDELKALNTELGGQGASLALRQVADVLAESVDRSDVAVRVGDDEFAILLSGCTHEAALRRAEALCQKICERSMTVGGKRVKLSVSAGVASFPEDGSTSAHILRRADQALVWAKAHGKNRAAHWRTFAQDAEAEARRAS